ncbi:MAG TPA: FecR domain-containing protein [Rhodocyclaceae bacterium]
MRSAALLLILALGLAGWAQAETAGTVTHLAGILSVKRPDGSTKVLSVRSEVAQGDLLTTEADTYARIKFVDGAEIVMRPGTQIKIEKYAYVAAKPEQDNFALAMLKGGLRAVTGLLGKRNHDKVNFNTPTATIGIRGTHFGALMCQNDCGSVQTTSGRPPANGLHLDVADGAIVVRNGAGQVQLSAGQFGFVASPNTAPMTVPPQEGIRVTMPTSISQNKGSGQGIGKGKQGECAM